jgi:prefoldin subunit 5
MKPTDHKAVLRALAERDGCEASKKAADHIEYLEKRLVSARDYEEQIRRKLAKVRHQRDELKRQLQERENA